MLTVRQMHISKYVSQSELHIIKVIFKEKLSRLGFKSGPYSGKGDNWTAYGNFTILSFIINKKV